MPPLPFSILTRMLRAAGGGIPAGIGTVLLTVTNVSGAVAGSKVGTCATGAVLP